MKGEQDPNIPAEWLAAYVDGELDRNAALAPMKERVEAWLAEHPEGRTDIEEQLRVEKLWQQTMPAEPDVVAWDRVLARLHDAPAELARRRAWSWKGIASILAVTAAGLALAFFMPTSGPNEEDEDPVFAVATADEIEILSIDGDATGSPVVGEVPVREPLELLQAGEMKITRLDADVPGNVRLDVHEGPTAPMIWAVLDAER